MNRKARGFPEWMPGTHTARPALLVFVMLALALLAFSPGRGEEGQEITFRIRPAVERADQEREDGFILLGSRGKIRKTATLCVGPEGKTAEGATRDLAALLRENGGTVIRAFWRFEGAGCEQERLRLVLEGEEGAGKSLAGRGMDGWNLWDVTDFLREALEAEEPVRLMFRTEKTGQKQRGFFDFRNSRLDVTLQLKKPDPALGPGLLNESDLLDAALSALPESHWALARYREVTGSLLRPKWPETGVPYYYGGHSEEKVMHRYFPRQESRYYRSNRLYLCGFDCGSFLHWAEETGGFQLHPDLSEILRSRSRVFPLEGLESGQWHQALEPGDLLVFQHPGYHAGMYLGTPRKWGVTAEENPELAGWLDAPLMIHCGEDPFCYDRFLAYIEAQDYRMDTSPPDGGVTVSLLVPRRADAPRIRTAPWGTEYGYFEMDGQPVTVFPLEDCTKLAWFRPVR